MSITTTGLITRAIMSADPAVRADAEDLATMLAGIQRAIFCQFTGAVLDIRTAVTLFATDGRVLAIVPGTVWDELASSPDRLEMLTRDLGGMRIFDGRWFTANGTRRKSAPAREL